MVGYILGVKLVLNKLCFLAWMFMDVQLSVCRLLGSKKSFHLFKTLLAIFKVMLTFA